MTGRGILPEKALGYKDNTQCFRGEKTWGPTQGFFFSSVILPLNSTQISVYFKGRGKMSGKTPKSSPEYFLVINGTRNSDGRVMHYEWMVSNGNWEPWHSTPGFSNRGQGGGGVESHSLLHSGVSRKESCELNIPSPSSYPTNTSRGKIYFK